MEAGHDLDLEIAGKILCRAYGSDLPPFSTDIAAAWQVVMYLRERYWVMQLSEVWQYIEIREVSLWICVFTLPSTEKAVNAQLTPAKYRYVERPALAKAPTAPLAICLAALQAISE